MARPRQVSDTEILEAAAACFLELGTNVSTQVIAERLNISQPALFKRFGTKEELMLRALLPPEQLPIVDWLNNGPSSDEPFLTQFEEVLGQLWEMVCFVLPRVSVLTSSGIAPDVIVDNYKSFPLVTVIQALAGWLGRAQDAGQIKRMGNPLSLAQACLGPLQGRALLRFVLGGALSKKMSMSDDGMEAEDNAYITLVAAMFVHGVGDVSMSDVSID